MLMQKWTSRFTTLVLLMLVLATKTTFGQDTAPTESYAHQRTMNGIKFSDYPEFWKTWRLVTTRFREDSGELRFTYANQLAWETLIKGRTDYAEGAVFAKIGYQTNKDPLFTSSVVPSGAKRVQFMVRQPKKYATTDGWGYALFDGDGKTFASEPISAAKACAACHQLAAPRGRVFSEPFNTNFKTPTVAAEPLHLPSHFTFKEMGTKDAPEVLRRFLPTDASKISRLEGDLTKHVIAGTLDEIRPELIVEARTQHRPAILINQNGDAFSAVWPDPSGPSCDNGKLAMAALISYPVGEKASVDSLFKYNHFCQKQ